jgi:PadR family transcriptional regulator PadR
MRFEVSIGGSYRELENTRTLYSVGTREFRLAPHSTVRYTVAVTDNAAESDWIIQTRRGVLELCLLMLLRGEPRYGYELLSALGQWPALELAEGTLYPLLRRLERSGVLQSKWVESPSRAPRKYYSLTDVGRRQLERKAAQWEAIANSVAELKKSDLGRGAGRRDDRAIRALGQMKADGGVSR